MRIREIDYVTVGKSFYWTSMDKECVFCCVKKSCLTKNG